MSEKNVKCPRCGSANVDEFRNAYWFLCRDCGYNAMPSSDEEQARRNFLDGFETPSGMDEPSGQGKD